MLYIDTGSSKAIRRLRFHLVKGSTFRLGNKNEGKHQTDNRQYGIGPKSSRKPNIFSHVHEGLDSGEGTDVGEAGGHGGADVAILEREDLSDEQPGNRADSQTRKEKNTKHYNGLILSIMNKR